MVLQRGRAVAVWGNAEPGERIAVEFAGAKVETLAGDDEPWLPMHFIR